MPLEGGRLRVKTTPKGEKIRLHFTDGGRVNEAKSLASGKVHTPVDFARDRKRKGSRLKAAMLGGSSHTSQVMR